ncbi:AbrB/MazE/SpoVT family DNA-binding domain-containing protein [Candidatus Poriferisodalis sp.]|uniref:AbrB/MazE/SpoVT family DNA-binding domain-containing protein n=1 Tax=Candidatus Poriferisodalis sp. TaxID=3101277 RepID=UPI003B027CBE
MPESTITSKGLTTLARRVRECLSLQPGDRLRYFIDGGTVRFAVVRPVGHLFGTLQFDGPPVTLDEMGGAIAETAGGRIRR